MQTIEKILDWLPGAAFLFAGVALCVLGVCHYRSARRFLATAQRTEGIILGFVRCSGRNPNYFILFPVFGFLDAEGNRWRVRSKAGWSLPPLKKRDRVPVLYNPDDPSEAKIECSRAVWGWWYHELVSGLAIVGLTVIGAFLYQLEVPLLTLPIIGVLMLGLCVVWYRRKRRFLALAERTEGTLVHFFPLKRKLTVVEFVDGGGSQRCCPMNATDSCWSIGDRVPVLYDPQDSMNAVIDSFLDKWLMFAVLTGTAIVILLIGLVVILLTPDLSGVIVN